MPFTLLMIYASFNHLIVFTEGQSTPYDVARCHPSTTLSVQQSHHPFRTDTPSVTIDTTMPADGSSYCHPHTVSDSELSHPIHDMTQRHQGI